MSSVCMARGVPVLPKLLFSFLLYVCFYRYDTETQTDLITVHVTAKNSHVSNKRTSFPPSLPSRLAHG